MEIFTIFSLKNSHLKSTREEYTELQANDTFPNRVIVKMKVTTRKEFKVT
jgi:hypothetical protein